MLSLLTGIALSAFTWWHTWSLVPFVADEVNVACDYWLVQQNFDEVFLYELLAREVRQETNYHGLCR